MPEIGEVKIYAVGFWQSQLCDNSLASYPSGDDFSWGNHGLMIDGLDSESSVNTHLIHPETAEIIQTIAFTTNGKKIIDLSQFSSISSTQDLKIVIEITTYI